MNLKEFINFRKKCIICDSKLEIGISGVIEEYIDEVKIPVSFTLWEGTLRKNKLSFKKSSIMNYLSEILDPNIWNDSRYLIYIENDILKFPVEFPHTTRFQLVAFCHDAHHNYQSRRIKVSNNSPDITKGYPYAFESFIYDNTYQLTSDVKHSKTTIASLNYSSPISINFRDLKEFYDQNKKNFKQRIDNLILLA